MSSMTARRLRIGKTLAADEVAAGTGARLSMQLQRLPMEKNLVS